MKNFRKILLIIIIGISLFLIWAFFFVINFHGDTYGKSESYIIVEDSVGNIELSVEDIIKILYKFQCSHLAYRLITSNTNGVNYYKFSDKIPNRSNQYMIFFYFKDMDITISCIVGQSSNNSVFIKLYAVSDGVNFAKLKQINNFKEISYKENRTVKQKFENEILDHLGVKWKHKI